MKSPKHLILYNSLINSINNLFNYISRNKYYGYDPFDVLESIIFKLPILKKNKIIRLLTQQTFKRLPVNIRGLLFVKKGRNPVTLGLCIHAYSNLILIDYNNKSCYLDEINSCITELGKLKSKGYSGACWGYDFDWEARYARIPAYTPTVVATGIITNALFECYKNIGNKRALELCIDSANFVLKDLPKTFENESFCYTYSPNDKRMVNNATMKGARLLSQVYSITKESKLIEEARNTVKFVVENQRSDGSWYYSKGEARNWIDNFHTGYVLDCLDEYINNSNDREFEPQLKKGVEFYVNNFFENNDIPRYYNDKTFPVDSTAAAQSIITLVRFGYTDLAERVAGWMIENMQDEKGYFYYQKNKYYTNKISYMRWSNAWMFSALSNLVAYINKTNIENGNN